METWFQLVDPPQSPSYNMACDEWLLYNIRRFQYPVLRVYGWDRPAVSIGYFQAFAGRDEKNVVRRPTGGGAVHHAGDATYTVVLPCSHPWYGLCACDRYRAVHQLVRNLFVQRSLEPAYATAAEPSKRGQRADCYAEVTSYDLILEGRKVAGGAQRKVREGLLHQGTVRLLEPAWGSGEWVRAWVLGGIRLEPLSLGPESRAEIELLAKGKYKQRAWNEMR